MMQPVIPRAQETRLQELLARFPVVAVVGARQVGKSTLVQRPALAAGRAYFTLDDFDTLGLAARDPAALLGAADRVTIDEIQRQPELLRGIKAQIDRQRLPGRYLITGSSDLNFSAGLARELAGRVGVLPLSPISWRERQGHIDRPAWLDWLDATTITSIEERFKPVTPKVRDEVAILTGGYPLAVTATDAAARRDWFEAYRYTYLERDVRQVSQIGNLSEFARLLEVAAGRTAQLLNGAALARDVGLSAATGGRYLSLLEATFQIVRLTPWFGNIGKRLVKSPKLYWSDTGLAAHLLGLRTWDEVLSHHMAGALFETFVMLEIVRQVAEHDPSARVHFLRTHTGLEVDGLLTRGVRALPFEIKLSTTVREEDGRPLGACLDLNRRADVGILFYRGRECRRLGSRVLAMPVTALLS